MQQVLSVPEDRVSRNHLRHSWDVVRSFIRAEGLDGIELVLGNRCGEVPVPDNLVKTVHLPIWPGWIRPWKEPQSIPAGGDPAEIAAHYGAGTPENLMKRFSRNLARAKAYRAAYAVVHASHHEPGETGAQPGRYLPREILAATASFANTLASRSSGGEPPVTLAFENLGSSGLTFLSPQDTEYFTGLLTFNNWIFVLDTGHLMNALQAENEREGVRDVIRVIGRLPKEAKTRIRAVHFHCSTSGRWQGRHHPPERPVMTWQERARARSDHHRSIDEHRPFSDPACRKIVAMIRPEFLVHEFVANTPEAMQAALRQQRALIGKPGSTAAGGSPPGD
nr:hypothetical protein [uncultured Methanoregula sp.]